MACVFWIKNLISAKLGEANSVKFRESFLVLLGFLVLDFIVDFSKIVRVLLEEIEGIIRVSASPI